jgi:hypothetical protein
MENTLARMTKHYLKTKLLHYWLTEQVGVALMLLTSIREVPGSKLGWDTGYHE